MTKEEERWEDLKGFEGLYKISTWGNIVSCKKTWLSGRWVIRTNPEKQMLLSKDKGGYLIVGLRKPNIKKMFKVHRLVAIQFINNPENKPQVNHKDCNKTNNNYINLEWNTATENMRHAYSMGLMPTQKGENHASNKLNNLQVLEIFKSTIRTKELCQIYNVSFATIRNIKTKKSWFHLTNQNNNKL